MTEDPELVVPAVGDRLGALMRHKMIADVVSPEAHGSAASIAAANIPCSPNRVGFWGRNYPLRALPTKLRNVGRRAAARRLSESRRCCLAARWPE